MIPPVPTPRRLLPAAVGAVVLAAALVGPAGAAAAILKKTPVVRPPAIRSFVVTPGHMPAGGGSVTVRAGVLRASRCTFRLKQGARSASRTVACSTGSALAVMAVGANTSPAAQTVSITLTAATGARKATALRKVVVAAKPAPPLEVTSGPDLPVGAVGAAYTATLAATGGTGAYHWTVASGTLPAGLALSGSGTISGIPAAPIGATVGLQVTDDARVVATTSVTIAISGSAPPVVAPSFGMSTNWSGYAFNGGPFTAVSGTFNVPQVPVGASDTDTAEWVGIDGWGSSTVLQAGVGETVQSGQLYVYAWWETYPDPAEEISSLPVNAGDEVTVAIVRQADGSWLIQVFDLTTGGTWHTAVSYSGQLLSAEWVVEAPTDAQSQALETLGVYTPPVTFKNLGVAGSESDLRQLVMYTDDSAQTPISTPSPWSPNGFTVAYGSATPPAP
jgi:hypothetical protein